MTAVRRWLAGLPDSARATIVDFLLLLLVVATYDESWLKWTYWPVALACVLSGWVAAIGDDRGWLGRVLCTVGLHAWSRWVEGPHLRYKPCRIFGRYCRRMECEAVDVVDTSRSGGR